MHSFKLVPSVLSATALATVAGTAASAAPTGATQQLEQIENYSNQGQQTQSQVNSVSQLRDVSPDDWAFEALRNLVETYGCIEGYPDQTYRGDRPLTRYEFAAGLNSCMQALEQQTVSEEDLQTLQRLVEEFEAELATLGTRVDNLEGRVATLEENQFSTTSKLDGEVLFGVGKAFEPFSLTDKFVNFIDARFDELERTGEADEDERDVGNETVFGNRVRLEINTSFTGRDKLSVRYQFRNMEDFDQMTTGTNMTDLSFGGGEKNKNKGNLDNLVYQFPVADLARVYIGANSIDADQGAIRPLNPFFESSGSGSLSQALQRDELIFDIPDDVSLGTKFDFSESLSLAAYYGVKSNDARNPRQDATPGEGLFEGNFGVLTQLLFEPSDSINLAFSYSHTYTDDDFRSTPKVASVASNVGLQPFGDSATTTDRFGIQSNFQLSDSINFSLWGSYAKANSKVNNNSAESIDTGTVRVDDGDSADLFSFGGTLAFLDLAKEGDRLGFGVTVPPKVTNNDAQITTTERGEELTADYEDVDTSVIVEAQYRYPITDRLHITPGGYAVINPGHNSNNDTNFVGILKTEFDF